MYFLSPRNTPDSNFLFKNLLEILINKLKIEFRSHLLLLTTATILSRVILGNLSDHKTVAKSKNVVLSPNFFDFEDFTTTTK